MGRDVVREMIRSRWMLLVDAQTSCSALCVFGVLISTGSGERLGAWLAVFRIAE